MDYNFKFVDVNDLKDLETLPNNKRYLEFLGGTKNYRCYIVDTTMPRCDFYRNYSELIEDYLQPIYKNRGIVVAQDNTFPLPGFYIISYEKQYDSIDDLPEQLMIRTASLLKYLRKGMRDVLDIKHLNIYYEEKNSPSNNVHIWLMPKTSEINPKEKLYELDMEKYLNSFDAKSNINKIKQNNLLMQKYFVDQNYKALDDKLFNKYSDYERKINLCISKYCFLKCLGCYNCFCNSEEISVDYIIKFLEYAKSKGLTKVTLSGGDPLARDDISIIIKKCLDLDLKVNLDTVGLSLIEDRKLCGTNKIVKKFKNNDLLKKISMIGIPLDGSNNEVISTFRKSNDNLFEKQLKIFDFFEKIGVEICVNTVFHKQNSKDMENIYNILKNYKCITKWQIFQYMPIGPLGKKNEENFKVSYDDFFLIRKKFEKIKNKNMIIEFKAAKERACNYTLVDSGGTAFKVDLNNNKNIYGNIKDSNSWDNILENIF